MQSIDLIDYADHSVKIPSAVLNKVTAPKPTSARKIIFSHWMDLWAVTSMTTMVSITFSSTVNSYFKSNFSAPFFFFTFSIIMVSYFFFSFFLNHGQSLGLFTIKKRIPMAEKNFSEALHWSLISSLTCLSGGLATGYFNLPAKVESHDYLYINLLNEKDVSVISLLEVAEARKSEEIKESYLQAA